MDILGEGEDATFTINTDYATRYDRWRHLEEYQKLKDRYGDDVDDSDSSSSESEDDNAEALTPQLEKDWLRTLAALKSKDPKIYNKDYKFYKQTSTTTSESEEEGKGKTSKEKKTKDKPMFLKDYERKVILEKGGVVSESEGEGEEEEYIERPPGYYEEQDAIKQSIAAEVGDSGSESENDLLTRRTKTKQQLEAEEADYLQWLKGQKEELDEHTVGVELNPLKDYWSNPTLSSDEKFLRDYILNKGYQDDEENEVPTYEEIVAEDGFRASDDERELEREEEFEHKYNFRFEDPDPEFIKSYPRTIQNSIRRKDASRTEKRHEIKERKKMEKAKKMEELKQLRNMKKRQVLDKVEQIKSVAGHDTLGLTTDDLEDDFDPEKHDRLMQQMFSDDYYGEEEDAEKPVWEDEELEPENWDTWKGADEDETGETPPGGGTGAEAGGEEGAQDEDQEESIDDTEQYFNMDADCDPSQDERPKKRNRKSKFAQAITKRKPVFDPQDKTFEQYFDEFYKLDYEDVIGNQPCRFKYRQVKANNFGLSTDEVLSAKEKELNQWVSVKKMVQYRTEEEEKMDAMIFRRKGQNTQQKLQILTSLNAKEEEENEEEKEDADGGTKKRKRKRRGRRGGDKSEQQQARQLAQESKKHKKRTAPFSQASTQATPNKKSKTDHDVNDVEITSGVTAKEGISEDVQSSKTSPKKTFAKTEDKKINVQVKSEQKTKASKEVIVKTETVEIKPKEVIVKQEPSEASPKRVKVKQDLYAESSPKMMKVKLETSPNGVTIKPEKERVKDKIKIDSSGKQTNVDEKRKDTADTATHSSMSKKQKKKKKGQEKSMQGHVHKLSDERLKAYGLNPKKMMYTHPELTTGHRKKNKNKKK